MADVALDNVLKSNGREKYHDMKEAPNQNGPYLKNKLKQTNIHWLPQIYIYIFFTR